MMFSYVVLFCDYASFGWEWDPAAYCFYMNSYSTEPDMFIQKTVPRLSTSCFFSILLFIHVRRRNFNLLVMEQWIQIKIGRNKSHVKYQSKSSYLISIF